MGSVLGLPIYMYDSRERFPIALNMYISKLLSFFVVILTNVTSSESMKK
jgi:hypothetical protein